MTMFRGSSIALDLLKDSVSSVPMGAASGARPRGCPYLTVTTWLSPTLSSPTPTAEPLKTFQSWATPDGLPPAPRPRQRPADGGPGAGRGGIPPRERPLRRPRVRGGPHLLREGRDLRVRRPHFVEQPRGRARRPRTIGRSDRGVHARDAAEPGVR